MSDFIYSNKIVEPGKLTREIQRIYRDEDLKVQEFHGKWGSLAVSHNLYSGFQPYETDRYIFVVIGGPVFYFSDNNHLKETFSNTGTKAIYSRWKQGKIKWDKDLSGPFGIIIINKQTSNVELITDLMSFIPIYIYEESTNIMFSTHVDMLAYVSGQTAEIDLISCSDFILHGVVTFPYTVYHQIFQVKPASKHSIVGESNKVKSEAYWVPKEEYKYKTIKQASDELIKGLKKYTYNITTKTSNLAQFISGGEDSRVLSALLQKYPRDAFVFLDRMNREGKMAKKAANTYGADFNLATRTKTHYIEILPSCTDLVGSGSQYHHAHTFGFHKDCTLSKYSAVFGGLLSDALLKGSHVRKKNISGHLPLIPDIKKYNYIIKENINNNIFITEVIDEIIKRRRNHLKYVKTFRSKSAEEWFELWPSSMNNNIPNIHSNRRLFRSYEPFTANEIVKISASVPQKWKLNRRLFHKAAKPLLKPTKWMFHSDGRLPYFPWYINSIVQFIYKFYKKIGLITGLIKGNQGSWGQWNVVVQSNEWEKAIIDNSKAIQRVSSILNQKDVKELLRDSSIHHSTRVNLMQVLYQIRRNNEL